MNSIWQNLIVIEGKSVKPPNWNHSPIYYTYSIPLKCSISIVGCQRRRGDGARGAGKALHILGSLDCCLHVGWPWATWWTGISSELCHGNVVIKSLVFCQIGFTQFYDGWSGTLYVCTCMYVFMCVYVCVCVCVCMYVYICMCMHVCIGVHQCDNLIIGSSWQHWTNWYQGILICR